MGSADRNTSWFIRATSGERINKVLVSSPWSKGNGSRPSKAGSVHVKLRILSTAAESPPLFSPLTSLHTHTSVL